MKKKNVVIIALSIFIIAGLFFTVLHLVKARVPHDQGSKVLYYRNPMNPEVTSPVPMKDSMGMDYVPVYQEERPVSSGIKMSQEKQQLIGIKKEVIGKRTLVYQIDTVGKVAYDPQLFVAQEEYIQALKTKEALGSSSLAAQSASLVEAAQRKLLLLGMTKEQIEEVGTEGKAQGNLYLPTDEKVAWVYITIYEYEAGLVTQGLPVEIEAVAFPGIVFQGKVMAVTPVLDAMTRSVQVRAQVQDPEQKLKPQMYVNARIMVELGEKLAVPETAVLDTGARKIVYLAKEGDILQQREVVLGQKAQGYYEVLQGLSVGDTVVTSGNFLVDSESKLQGQ
jgi:Cu(I)/Ag(I) efflux system membrane fusion protein